jgi:hypothetical protein
MDAEFFNTDVAAKFSIGFFTKPFRILIISHFPSNEHQQRYDKKTERIIASDKNQRSKYHQKIPVIYAASYTTAVFHYERLKRTVE